MESGQFYEGLQARAFWYGASVGGSKIVKSNKITSFLDDRLQVFNATFGVYDALLKPLVHMLFYSLAPPTNYILTLVKPFAFV